MAHPATRQLPFTRSLAILRSDLLNSNSSTSGSNAVDEAFQSRFVKRSVANVVHGLNSLDRGCDQTCPSCSLPPWAAMVRLTIGGLRETNREKREVSHQVSARLRRTTSNAHPIARGRRSRSAVVAHTAVEVFFLDRISSLSSLRKDVLFKWKPITLAAADGRRTNHGRFPAVRTPRRRETKWPPSM